MTKARRLRDLVNRPGAIIAPGAYDALTAKIVEWAGFEAVFMSGFAVEAGALGKPDLGYLTLSESATTAGHMAQAVGIPVIADADVGFGGALNVARSVREFEMNGVAAIMLEDQTSPKRCGALPGVTVVPRGEFVGKIKAAFDAREDPDFVILARTDAYETEGIREVIDRANACVDAGADLIFVAGSYRIPPEERERIVAAVRAPMMAAITASLPSGATESVDGARRLDDVRSMEAKGYKLLVPALEIVFVVTKAVMDFLTVFRATGELHGLADRMIAFDDFDEFIGLRETIRHAMENYGDPISTPGA